MDYERIDINQCPKGQGNSGPNHFADTARCKTDTTEVPIFINCQCGKSFYFLMLFIS